MKLLAAIVLSLALCGCAALASDEATIGCQAVDTITTVIAINKGAVEANPLMAAVIDSLGLGGFVLVKIAITTAIIMYTDPKPGSQTEAARAAVNVVTCGAAVNNVGVINRL